MLPTRSLTKMFFGSAAALLACAALAAQAPGMPPSQQPTMPQQTQPGAQPGMQPGMPGSPNSAPTESFADKAFVQEAMQGNDAEVQLAQLAQQKSQSADVKQFAQKMQSEHQQMNQKWFAPEAKNLGVSVPKGPSKKDKKMYEKMQTLSGDDFDKAYIAAMLKDHQDDLKKYKDETESAQDPGLKQVAQLGEKVISQHLELAQQLAKAHNVPVEGSEVSSR